MQNPIATLLYGLFVAPVLRVLQATIDRLSGATSSVKSILRGVSTKPKKIGTGRTVNTDTRSHWEKMGVALPVYNLLGQGLSDHEIAIRLSLSENTVYGCTGYLVRRLKCRTRAELVLYASPKTSESWTLRSSPTLLLFGARRWRQKRLANSLLVR